MIALYQVANTSLMSFLFFNMISAVMNPISQHPNMVMLNQQRPVMVSNAQFTNQQIQAPPGYHNPAGNICSKVFTILHLFTYKTL